MRLPLVSVCLPVYNGERYVEAAIRSVLTQTFRDFELIVLDDGSTDRSAAVVSDAAAGDARVRLIQRSNAGLIATLNELLASARGEFIARMDADDVCRPTRFERQVAHLVGDPSCVAVGSRCLFIDPDGLPICEFVDALSHAEIERSLMKTEFALLHPAAMIRRSALDRLGTHYRPSFRHAEDLDLFLRLGEVGRLANLDEVLLDYRLHVASVSHRHTEEQSASAWRAVAAARGRRGDSAVTTAAVGPRHAESREQLHRKWAWWALDSGHLATARKHARLALANGPLEAANYRLAASVLRDTLVWSR